MDPGADDGAALPHGAEGGRDEVAHRREDDDRVELLGRAGERIPGPDSAKRARERLGRVVARAGSGEDAPSLCDGDLADDVGRGPEAVKTDRFAVAREPERAVPDQPGAEQGRGLLIRIAARDDEAEALVGDDTFRVPAVEVLACETGRVAEVLLCGEAVAARAVRPPEPGDADAIACLEARVPSKDLAHDLVTGHERKLRLRQFAVDDMEIRSADAARTDLQQYLTRRRLGLG